LTYVQVDFFQFIDDFTKVDGFVFGFDHLVDFLVDDFDDFVQFAEFNQEGILDELVGEFYVADTVEEIVDHEFEVVDQLSYGEAFLVDHVDVVDGEFQVLDGGQVVDQDAADQGNALFVVVLGEVDHEQFFDFSVDRNDFVVEPVSQDGGLGGVDGGSNLLQGDDDFSQVQDDFFDNVDVGGGHFLQDVKFLDDIVDAVSVFQGLDNESLFHVFVVKVDEFQGVGNMVGDGLDLVQKFGGVFVVKAETLEGVQLDVDVAQAYQVVVEDAIEDSVVVEHVHFFDSITQFPEYKDDFADVHVKISQEFVDVYVIFDHVEAVEVVGNFGQFDDDFVEHIVFVAIILDFYFQQMDEVLDGIAQIGNLDYEDFPDFIGSWPGVLEEGGKFVSNKVDLVNQISGVLFAAEVQQSILEVKFAVLQFV